METVARKTWLCRNTMVFRGDFTYPSQLIRNAKVALEGFNTAVQKAKNSVEQERINVEAPKWMVPPFMSD